MSAEAPWRCFHCGEVFSADHDAALHFGPRDGAIPACRVDAQRLRDLEVEIERRREEDTDLHRQIGALRSDHHLALRREEEAGYARGLSDFTKVEAERDAARAEVERLRTRLGEAVEEIERLRPVHVWTADARARENMGLSERYRTAEAEVERLKGELDMMVSTGAEAVRLMVEQEREACAKLADAGSPDSCVTACDAYAWVAAAIRARSCVVDPVLSRSCELGTKSCRVKHGGGK